MLVDQKAGNNLLYLPIDKLMQMTARRRSSRRSRRKRHRPRSRRTPAAGKRFAAVKGSGALMNAISERYSRPYCPAHHRVARAVRGRSAPERDRLQARRSGSYRERKPGLYVKIPLLDNVRYFDTRILTIDTAEPERFLTSEKRNVLVDLFVKWRIIDVRSITSSVGGDEARARTRLLQTINDSSARRVRQAHRPRGGLRRARQDHGAHAQRWNEDARKIGVQVLDVRMKRVDLPQEVSESVYRRMEAERKRVANELRSTGARRSREDPRRRRPPARSHPGAGLPRRAAHQGRGRREGARRFTPGRISSNPEFYSFYRSLEAYRQSSQEQERRAGARSEFGVLQVLQGPGGKAGK